MATIRDKASGKTYEVPDVDAFETVKTNPGFEIVGNVTVGPSGPSGSPTVAPAEYVGSHVEATPSMPGDEDRLYHEQYERQEHDTLGSRARAFVGGGANMLSLGFTNPWKDDQEFHSGYTVAGKIAGILPTLLIPGAGEENLARVGVEGAEALSGAGRAVGQIAAESPLGWATRVGSTVGRSVEARLGGGLVGRVAGTAAEGATSGAAIGLGTGLSRQLLDDNVNLSAEGLLSDTLEGAALGGGIGLGGGLVSEGIGALKGLRGVTKAPGTSAEEFASRASARPPTEFDPTGPGIDRPPLSDLIGPNASRHVTTIDGLANRATDLTKGLGIVQDMLESPVLMSKAGLTKLQLQEAAGTMSRELNGIKSFGRNADAELPHLAADAHANDLTMTRLSQATDRVPARWSDPQLRAQALEARDAALTDIASKRAKGLPVSQAEEDAARYAAQLGVGRAPAETADIRSTLVGRVAQSLVNRIPGGRLVSQLGLGAAKVGLGVAAVEHGVGVLLHGASAAALPAAGLLGGAAVVRALFKDPRVGGRVAGTVAGLLNSTAVPAGGDAGTSQDPRRALRELADRARTVTPQSVAASTVASLGHSAGVSPNAVMLAGQAAANRHSALIAELDRLDPPVRGQLRAMLGRPLPTAEAARRAASAVHVMSDPMAVLGLALRGGLTADAVRLAGRVWPATLARIQNEVRSQLSVPGAGDRLTHAQRTTVETLLGSPDRSSSYRSSMADSISRGTPKPPSPGPGPAPGARELPPAPTPATAAAHPGQYK